MSSFSVFDSKGGEFRGPKASINLLDQKLDHNNLHVVMVYKWCLQVVMVREREDSGLWISLCNLENLLDQKQGLNP